MKLVRPMVLLLMSKNIQVRALHIPVVNNAISDSVSFSAPAFQPVIVYIFTEPIKHAQSTAKLLRIFRCRKFTQSFNTVGWWSDSVF
jgi:hypothetical protein